MSSTYDNSSRGSGAWNVKWNGIALAGRQAILVVFALVLAQMLGPTEYGIVAQATVFTTFLSLLLDQGVAASLISRKDVDVELLRAAITVNLGLAAALGIVTVFIAEPVAAFMNTPDLSLALPVLAVGLFFKGMQIVPRLILMREFKFRGLAIAEIGSALIGGLVGVAAAAMGAGFWAAVSQLVIADVVLAVVLLMISRPPLPGLKLSRFLEIFGFSIRVLIGNLVSFGSRNIDTVLIGKFLGSTDVGLYNVAYRVLLLPTQMVGQAVTRVMFPSIARDQNDKARVSAALIRAARAIALITFPAMALIAAAAHDAVLTILGEEWLDAVPVIAILAITGARQSITTLNSPTMLGFGRADWHMRFVICAAIFQISGMVAGMPFGILGVAVGYTVVELSMTPVVFWIQRRLAGTPIRRQLGLMLAPAHASLWAAAAYIITFATPLDPIGRLAVGLPVGLCVYMLVLRIVHRSSFDALIRDSRAVLGGRRGT